MTDCIRETADRRHINYTYEHSDAENIFRMDFQLQSPLKSAKLELLLKEDKILALTTVLVNTELRPVIQERLNHLPIPKIGDFSLDANTGILCYCMDVGFDVITNPIDIEFLWLAPLTAIETLASNN